MTEERPLSPDGRWYWDGTTWVPVPWKSFSEPVRIAARPMSLQRRLLRDAGLVVAGVAFCFFALIVVGSVLFRR